MDSNEEEIGNRFMEKAENGKITCAEALALAKELGISTFEVAPMLTSMNIKIKKCQLGCFQ